MVGDKNSRYCLLSDEGEVLREGQVATTKAGMTEMFGRMGRARIAIEVGTHSPWVSRLLQSLGHELIVANPRQVKLITESSRKDDRLDAQTLARLARIDPLVATVRICAMIDDTGAHLFQGTRITRDEIVQSRARICVAYLESINLRMVQKKAA